MKTTKLMALAALLFGFAWNPNSLQAEDWESTWSTATLSQARYDLSATSAGGKVFFGGGVGGSGYSDIVDIYDTVTSSWSTETLSQARISLSATSAGGKVFFGGGRGNSPSNVVDVYDTATSTWSTETLSQPRYSLSATSAGGKVFFGGGLGNSPSDVVDVYDTATSTWSTETLSQPRRLLSTASAGNKVFFGGGLGNSPSDVVDVYNTATSTWSTETLSQPRYSLSATSAGGKVFFGGGLGNGPSDVVDVYDTATSTWSTETLSQPRRLLSTASAGNKVFFGGGLGNTYSDVVDIYRLDQNYNSITSTQDFTLIDQTTVAGQMLHSGPGSLDLARFDLTVGSMSGDAPINLGGNTLTVGSDNSSPGSYSGAITGGGNLVKIGTGKLTLGNQLSADITISQGRIEAGSGTVVNGNVTIAAGTRLVNNGGDLALDNLSNSGVLDGSAEVNGSFANGVGASVRVGAGQQVALFSTSSKTNGGLIEVVGNENALGGQAEFESVGLLTNAASTGLITGRAATLRFDGGLDNQGSVALSFGTSDVFGDIVNTGNIAIAGGGSATFYDDVDQEGSLMVSTVGSTVSTAVFFGAFTGSGGFTGGGDVFLLGDLAPGSSPAEVVFDGNVNLGISTSTTMELAGTLVGDEYDKMSVTGQLAVAGSLDVVLLDGFEPAASDSFDLFDGTIVGTFSSVSLPAISADLSWNTSSLYTTGIISVSAVPEPTSLMLSALGLFGLLTQRRRKK